MKTQLSRKTKSHVITAANFKSRCLQLMDEVSESSATFVITKRGKPVAQLTALPPEDRAPFRSIIGRTPGIRLPSDAEWKKSKDEWADEWDKSTKRLGRQLEGDFSED